MPTDATTFLFAFLAVFGLIAGYLVHLERRARRLEDRLALLEASTTPKNRDQPANPRNRE